MKTPLELARMARADGGEVDKDFEPLGDTPKPKRIKNELGLYSKAAEVAANLPQAKGTVDQMLAMMAKHGVKPAEMLNAGRPIGNTITKQELADHFNKALPKAYLSAHDEGDEDSDTKYHEYKLPGGENYREHILMLPKRRGVLEPTAWQPMAMRDHNYHSPHWDEQNALAHVRLQDRFEEPEGFDKHVIAHEDRLNGNSFYVRLPGGNQDIGFKTKEGADAYANSKGISPQYVRPLHTNHKMAIENAVADGSITPEIAATLARIKKVTGSKYYRMPGLDKRVLHVDEMQSDWGQYGRKNGFYDPENPYEVFHTGTGETVSTHKTADEAMKALDEIEPAGNAYKAPEHDWGHGSAQNGTGDPKVPVAPYVGSTQGWTDLALKHILHQAARGNYDRVVFTPGEHHDERYGGDMNLSPYYYQIVPKSAMRLVQQHDASIKPETSDLEGKTAFGFSMTPKAKESILAGQPAFKDGGTVETPLEGMPTSIKIPQTGETIKTGPHPLIRQVARDYMAKAGLPYHPPTKYAKVDPARSARIAAAYDAMRDDPEHPLVKASYAQMAKETMAQYLAAKKAGFKAEFWDPDTQEDPYKASPRLAVEDIGKNNHMFVYPTMSGYGTGTKITPEDLRKNPLLADSGERWNGKPALMNDIFRAVHDYYGHAKEGVGFRHDGEENAWRAHASMFSPLARMAMTSETRGQNSWLNFGPHGEKNRNARTEDTVFAPQKVGVMPQWAHEQGAEDFIQPSDSSAMVRHIRQYSTPVSKALDIVKGLK